MLEAGAVAYLTKSGTSEELLKAIRAVHATERAEVFGPEISNSAEEVG